MLRYCAWDIIQRYTANSNIRATAAPHTRSRRATRLDSDRSRRKYCSS